MSPIPMVMHCPMCLDLHLDEGEWATKPHKTHKCLHCSHEWRPANVPTVGVVTLPVQAEESAPNYVVEVTEEACGRNSRYCTRTKRWEVWGLPRERVAVVSATLRGQNNRLITVNSRAEFYDTAEFAEVFSTTLLQASAWLKTAEPAYIRFDG